MLKIAGATVAVLLIATVVSGCSAPSPTETESSAPAPLTQRTQSPTPSSDAVPDDAVLVDSVLVDAGKRPRAAGEFVMNADGSGSYLVVDNDVAIEIAARFGLDSLGQLENAEGAKIGTNIPIFEGETLTLLPR
jgi:hypothetical protein